MWSLTGADNAAWPSERRRGSPLPRRRVHHAVEEATSSVLAREVPVIPSRRAACAGVSQSAVWNPRRRKPGGRDEDPLAAFGIAATAGVRRDHLVIMAAGRYRRQK
jgi:hypothetical protein